MLLPTLDVLMSLPFDQVMIQVLPGAPEVNDHHMVRCYIVNQKRLADVLPCQVHWYKERTLIVYPNFYLCSTDVQ
ncbi:unnamed protein product [Camellia sinensis]